MAAVLVSKTFRHVSGALAKGVTVRVVLRGTDTEVTTLVTDQLGTVHHYFQPGQYDWVVLGAIIPFDVIDNGVSGGAPDYVHTQSSPAAQWTINHFLNDYIEPLVFLADAPTIPVETDVEYPSPNTTILLFPEPVAGRAEF